MPTATTQRARREASRRNTAGQRESGTRNTSSPSRRSNPAESLHARDRAQGTTHEDHDWVQETWKEYKKEPQLELRERLIVFYMKEHVRRIAERVRASLPSHVDVDDLMQQGFLGLVESIERFELDRGFKFETFSSLRIRGSMRDWLRAQDHLPRLMRTRSRQIATGMERFRVMHGREPDAAELQDVLGLDNDAFEQCFADRSAPMVVTLGSLNNGSGGGNEDDGGAIDALRDHVDETPLQKVQRQDIQRWVTKDLDSRDRMIIILYYYEAMTMREIGNTVGCSESRVSQRLDLILKLMRARFTRGMVALELAG